MKAIGSLVEKLAKEALEAADPCAERCADLIRGIASEKAAINSKVLVATKLGKILTKSSKAFKRHKRTSSDDEAIRWEKLMKDTDTLLDELKAAVKTEEQRKASAIRLQREAESKQPGLPKSSGVYKTRLEQQRKEIYKNPPALPPAAIAIDQKEYSLPKRDKSTGELSFQGKCPGIKDFRPNRTPEEVLRAGSFGGTYFRPIVSAVTNIAYSAKEVLKTTVAESWIDGLDKSKMLTSTKYRNEVNKYGVKCGGSLGMWESSGWIADSDPYGWFQWYCRFYRGRRSSDDQRQISRWLKSAGPKGRFRSQLCNKVLAARTRHDDSSISPVIRQTLLHWGLEITSEVLQKHKMRVGI